MHALAVYPSAFSLIFEVLSLLESFLFEIVQVYLQVVLLNYLAKLNGLPLFYRGQLLSALFAFAVTEFNDFVASCSLLPTAAIVGVIEINQEQGVKEIHKCITFIKFACRIDGEIQKFVGALVGFIDFCLQFFFGVLVGNVAEHNVSSLFVAGLNAFDKFIVQKFEIFTVRVLVEVNVRLAWAKVR